MNVAELKSKSMTELNDLAATCREHRNLRRQELIFKILQAEAAPERADVCRGVLK